MDETEKARARAARLKAARKRHYKSLADAMPRLTKELNLKKSTAYQHEDGRNPFIHLAEDYARIYNTTAQWLLYGDETPIESGGMAPVPHRGEARAGIWQEDRSTGTALIDTTEISHMQPYALTVSGQHCNLIARDGCVVGAVPLGHFALEPDDHLVIAHYRGDLVEYTIRHLKFDPRSNTGQIVWLSTDPAYASREPIRFDGTAAELPEGVEIAGVVVSVRRPLPDNRSRRL